jgi:hypothetical protein
MTSVKGAFKTYHFADLGKIDWDAINGAVMPSIKDELITNAIRAHIQRSEEEWTRQLFGATTTITSTTGSDTLTNEKMNEAIKKLAAGGAFRPLPNAEPITRRVLSDMNTEYLLPKRFVFRDDRLVPKIEGEPEPTPEGYGQW